MPATLDTEMAGSSALATVATGSLSSAIVPAKGGPPSARKRRTNLAGEATEVGPATQEASAGLKKPTFKDENKKLMSLMVKQLLKVSQQTRDIEGVVFETVIGPADSAAVKSALTQNTTYSEQTKVKGRGHGLGPPHHWTFGGFISGLAESPSLLLPTKTKLQEALKNYGDMNEEAKNEVVRFFRISKMHDSSKKRLTYSLGPAGLELREHLNSALDQLSWEKRCGKAPTSHMERELQKWLEALIGTNA